MEKKHKYYIPLHLDGNNRGCEGIAKGTAMILGKQKDDLVGLCTNIPLDKKLNIDQFVTLVASRRRTLLFRIVNRIYYEVLKFFTTDNLILSSIIYFYDYHFFIKRMNKGDVMLSTGGDLMCYVDNQVITTSASAKRQGAKTILWACSMGKNNLTPRKEKALRGFDLIYARETLSFEFFKSLGLKNVICYPDPAFILQPEETDLPICFTKGQVIGVNLSNYTVGAYDLNTPFGREVKTFLNYIFKSTSYQVLLIPHVMWKGQDDRIISKAVIDEYNLFADRITILNSEDLNYLQIRYVISQCHAFIGGRTHAVISAYSTYVPTIALGYSIKSRGISKDLDIPDKYVLDSKHVNNENELLNAFLDLEVNVEEFKKHLSGVIPEYIGRTKDIKSIIEKI